MTDRRKHEKIGSSNIRIDEASSLVSNDDSSNNIGIVTMTHLTQGDHLSHMSHCSNSKIMHDIHQQLNENPNANTDASFSHLYEPLQSQQMPHGEQHTPTNEARFG